MRFTSAVFARCRTCGAACEYQLLAHSTNEDQAVREVADWAHRHAADTGHLVDAPRKAVSEDE